ncbi:FMN-binding protein [Catenulispora sp. NF23]|uniref:FMN-binding protein n=1 Tax=Catenulispora pinistramenti TaxID=2705254 RepID=A0ABS5KSQ6_9ACTN|nr:FMN-binding protein [Catenulispora pinistramenti]MBS2534643.1 FMN-binding protein [Catenulispora pinistramenti]MBS2549054.1 FMN-binding protein [Catenulispora pinistramenti]
MPIPHIKTLLSIVGTAGAMGGLMAAKTSAHGLLPKPPSAAESALGTGSSAVMTVTGPPIPITHGIVQVRITMAAGRITSVAATSLPHDNNVSWARSVGAASVLAREVIAAQSAHVDAVTGATYTSDAYMKSLQAAIDAGKG